ncbi:MAG: hypothetical protein ABI959_13345 [Candidatus Dormiibacterota bacterium]
MFAARKLSPTPGVIVPHEAVIVSDAGRTLTVPTPAGPAGRTRWFARSRSSAGRRGEGTSGA